MNHSERAVKKWRKSFFVHRRESRAEDRSLKLNNQPIGHFVDEILRIEIRRTMAAFPESWKAVATGNADTPRYFR